MLLALCLLVIKDNDGVMINKSCKENLWLLGVLRVIILLLILMMIVLVTGCSQKKTENEQVNLQEKSERSSVNKGEKEDENVIEEFKSIVPSAKIIDYAVSDLDENGEEDYIILFSMKSGEQQYSSCLAVCLSHSSYSAIALSNDEEFKISSDLTAEKSKNGARISVELQEVKTETSYLYTIDYTYDDDSKEASYKIETEILE